MDMAYSCWLWLKPECDGCGYCQLPQHSDDPFRDDEEEDDVIDKRDD